MNKPTLDQSQELLKIVSQSGIGRDQLQALLEKDVLLGFLLEFMANGAELEHPEPTITPIKFARNYGQTLAEARDAMMLDGYVESNVNDDNFPPEGRVRDREFVLICFRRYIDDHADPDKSELLQELDKLGLQPEGAIELCFAGARARTRELRRAFPIVARWQVWRFPSGGLHCPMLSGDGRETSLSLSYIEDGWSSIHWFLASRK